MNVTRPLRVVVVSGNTPPTIDGVSDYTRSLLSEMHALRPNWEWLWIGRRQRWFNSLYDTDRQVRILRPSHTWGVLGTSFVSLPIRILRPNILHIQDQIHSFHETGAASRLASAAEGRVITTLHEFHLELPSVVHTMELVRRSTIVIANDSRTAERCVRVTGRVPDFTWWSGSNVRPPEPSWGVRQNPFLVTTFGQISEIKTFGIVYDALRRIRNRYPALTWQIVGPFSPVANPFHAELQRQFSTEWVRFTGAYKDLESKELRATLASGCAMILPFADGASPRRTTLQAAWAFGVPVVTTPSEANEPEIIDGANCILVDEPTIDAWEKAIERVLVDHSLRVQLTRGALMSARRFAWSALAKLHVEVYELLVKRQHA